MDNAIAQIQTMVDEVHTSVVDLKVKPEFHKYLIGKKRTNVKRVYYLINYFYINFYKIIFYLIADSRFNKHKNNFSS